MKIFQDIKITILFWLKVFGEILRSLDITGTIMNSIPSIAAVLLVSVFSGVEISKIDALKVAWTKITGEQPDAWLTVFAIAFVYIFIGIIYQPAKIHKELGGFIENPFSLEVYHSKKQTKETDDKWVSLAVVNKSVSENIENCFLRLDDIVSKDTNKSIIEDIQKLTWSSREHNQIQHGDQPLSISASDFGVCDVARTLLENNTAFFTTWFGEQHIDNGLYDLTICVLGTFKKHQKCYMYRVQMMFGGKKKIQLYEPVFIGKCKDATAT